MRNFRRIGNKLVRADLLHFSVERAFMILNFIGNYSAVVAVNISFRVVSAVICTKNFFAICRFAVDCVSVQPYSRRNIFGGSHSPLYFNAFHAELFNFRYLIVKLQIGKRKRIFASAALRFDFIFLPARLFAKPSVAAVSAYKGTHIAMPGKRTAKGSVNENFRVDFLGYAFNFFPLRFPCKNNSRKSVFFGNRNSFGIIYPRLSA